MQHHAINICNTFHSNLSIKTMRSSTSSGILLLVIPSTLCFHKAPIIVDDAPVAFALSHIVGDNGVEGIVTFTQIDSLVQVQGTIGGLSPGLHGFHVHQFGDLRSGCGGTGPHFNPADDMHGSPISLSRHVGDLGNIVAGNDGIAVFEFEDNFISLHGGIRSIIGRGVVVHANPDTLVADHSKPGGGSGDAGARVACGSIVIGSL